jgi:Fe2+ or Zn2+ uptake regulation protein
MKVDLIQILKENNIKITNERKAIVSALERSKLPLSSLEIFARVKPHLPKANISTVYRNLEMLEGLNVVKRLAFHKDFFTYELAHNRPHHHHAVCTRCGKVEDLENISEEFVYQISKKTKFTIEDHNLEFFGICEKCKMEEK